jgi:hypothetical protein
MIIKLSKNYFVIEQGYFSYKSASKECTTMYYDVTCYVYNFLLSTNNFVSRRPPLKNKYT